MFLKSLGTFVEDKEGEIEKICGENYQVSMSHERTGSHSQQELAEA